MVELSKIAGAVVVLGAAAGAAAGPVTVSQSLSLNQLLNGGTASLQFDLSATLAAQGLSASNALSGTLVVYGVSDTQYTESLQYGAYQVTGSYVAYAGYYYVSGGYYACGSTSFWGGCNSYYFVPTYSPAFVTAYSNERTLDNVFNDATVDRMIVALGGSSASDDADFLGPIATGYGSSIYEGTSGYNSYYRREQNVYQGYSGALNVSLGMDSLALSSFATGGLLNGMVSAGPGQFRITNATLTVQVGDTSPTNSVPEPSTLALAAAATVGLAASRRQRSAKK